MNYKEFFYGVLREDLSVPVYDYGDFVTKAYVDSQATGLHFIALNFKTVVEERLYFANRLIVIPQHINGAYLSVGDYFLFKNLNLQTSGIYVVTEDCHNSSMFVQYVEHLNIHGNAAFNEQDGCTYVRSDEWIQLANATNEL